MAGFEQSEEFKQLLNESAQLLRQNRPGEAVVKLKALYEKAPHHPDVAINLSGAYILQRRWNQAVKVLNKAVSHHPDNAMLWTNLGAAQLGRLELSGPRQQKKAIEAYQHALQADPDAPNVHYHLGLIYKERGELMRASAFFQRALEVNPADRDARLWLDRLNTMLAEEQRARKREEDEPTHSEDTQPGSELGWTDEDALNDGSQGRTERNGDDG